MKVPVFIKEPTIPLLSLELARSIIKDTLAEALNTLEAEAKHGLDCVSCFHPFVEVYFFLDKIEIRYNLSEKYQCRIEIPYPENPRDHLQVSRLIPTYPRKVVWNA